MARATKIEIPTGGAPIHHIRENTHVTLLVEQESGYTDEPVDVIPRYVNGEQNNYRGQPEWVSIGKTSLRRRVGRGTNRWQGSIGVNTLITTRVKGDAAKTRRLFNDH